MSVTAELPRTAPPWGGPADWHQANHQLAWLIGSREGRLGRAKRLALTIQSHCLELYPVMDWLCASTCPRCQDPCCLRARVWLDFLDLLLLHLTASPIPCSQLIPNTDQACAYAGDTGCLLDRRSRPWICLWYVCPAQTAMLNRRPALSRRTARLKRRIKANRQALENEFIRQIT
jgi:hypothetical protein